MIRIAVLVLLFTAATLSPPSSAFSQEMKICTIDLQESLGRVREGQEALQSLTSELERRQSELNVAQEELGVWMAELETQITVLSPEQRQERLAEYERRVSSLQQTFQGYQSELSRAEAQATQRIFERMLTVVTEVANENGCTFVLQNSAVLFGPDGLDFTDELVRRYDARH